MGEVLQRFIWNGEPVDLGEAWRLRKGAFEAVCRLVSHQFGWELRLVVNDALTRSQVCRSQEDVLETYERWRAAMIERGWQ